MEKIKQESEAIEMAKDTKELKFTISEGTHLRLTIAFHNYKQKNPDATKHEFYRNIIDDYLEGNKDLLKVPED